MNSRPQVRLNEAISRPIRCVLPGAAGGYWARRAAGDEKARRCGSLKDHFGVARQVLPGGFAKHLQ
ncbi:MAG: VOC family protein [Planctomycetales bacterium]|nr:VOC family protein [Planctomycetales bacterium]